MNKKSQSILLLLASLALTGCFGDGDDENPSSASSDGGFVPGENISVFNAEGHYYRGGVDQPSNALPIYNAKGKGDVPYVNVKDYVAILSSSAQVQGLSYEVKDKTGVIASSELTNSKAVIDPTKNEIRLINYANLLGSGYMNNGFGRDYCKALNNQAVRASNKTKAIVEGENEAVISLNEYGINLYEQGNAIYAPLELLSVVLNNAALTHDIYNGKDYFFAPESFKSTPISAYCYSGEGAFAYGWVSGADTYVINYKTVTPKSGEKYRFAGLDNGGGETGTDYLLLYEDGSGKFMTKVNEQMEERVFDGFVHRVAYERSGDTLTLYVLNLLPGTEGNASKDNYSSLLRINMGKTRFNQAERTQAAADFNYGLICLNFDKFYGVKEFKTQGNFDSFFQSKGLKEKLKSVNVETYVDAYYEFLAKEIGDGHTSMNSLPVYMAPNTAKRNALAEKYSSSRVKAITDRQHDLAYKRWMGTQTSIGHDFALIKNKTAFCAFDVFASDGYANYFRNYAGMEPEQAINDTCAFVSNAITYVEDYNKREDVSVKVENIVFDLTANGGGSMLTMPYLAGIMLKDPAIRVKDQISGRIVEYHYECDFDGDGNYGDTYADKYHFAVMTSSASFSCGTALPSMLKGTDVKLIGETSAGGACPVTHFTDGLGTAFQTSGSDVVVYKDAEGKYISVEQGVPVDLEVPENDWYNLEVMDQKVSQLFAK